MGCQQGLGRFDSSGRPSTVAMAPINSKERCMLALHQHADEQPPLLTLAAALSQFEW